MQCIVYEWPESKFWLGKAREFEEGVYVIEHSEQLNNPAVCVRSDLVADVLVKQD